ncbi:MAG: Rieske 2Fe-2S domain-containing protein [Desulfobacteraceae bacterium]|jgi:nitrite reductase/ring-hydroxylating ferredoxin subunit
MGLIERILGISKTKKPGDEKCWTHSTGKIEVDWARAPELRKPCGAIRLEGRDLPERVLVIYGIDGQFHAVKNRCTDIMGRRIDPVVGKAALKCCCLARSTFDYSGQPMAGPAKGSLKTYPVEVRKCQMIIRLD